MQFSTVYVLYSLMKQMWCSRIEHVIVDKWRKKGKEIYLARISNKHFIYGISGLLVFGSVALVLPDCE